MLILVPRTTPLSPPPPPPGGGVKIDKGSQQENLYFLFRKYIIRYFNYKIQKNNHSYEKCLVLCLTGASGPPWGPRTEAQGPKLPFSNIVSRCRSSAAISHCVCIFRSRITVIRAWECLRWPHLLAREGGGGWGVGKGWTEGNVHISSSLGRKCSHFIFFRKEMFTFHLL